MNSAHDKFFRSESTGGLLLLIALMMSLVIANSPFASSFSALLQHSIGSQTITGWINDGLMAVFFLLIGLEIKRELIDGELASVKRAALPIIAAAGGAILPAIIYFLINRNSAAQAGWGIPMATDIAFALAAISLLGSRVPASVRIFLAALAIVDDLIAIIVIAVFYSSGIEFEYLFYSLTVFGLLLVLNRMGVTQLWCYLLPGIFLWYYVHNSGIHATIAGVLTAIAIPSRSSKDPSPLQRLERKLTMPVNFFIMPLFALANTNISITGKSFDVMSAPLGWGILAGLLLGKPAGIFFASWITVKARLGVLPQGVRWAHIVGLGVLGGIGFTMSIFIALLSFSDTRLHEDAKFAILLSSMIAAILGVLILMSVKTKEASR